MKLNEDNEREILEANKRVLDATLDRVKHELTLERCKTLELRTELYLILSLDWKGRLLFLFKGVI